MLERVKAWLRGLRVSIGVNIIFFAVRIIPTGPFKDRITYSVCDAFATTFEIVGDTARAETMRRTIAPLRLGGRKGERARRRKVR